MHCIFSSPFLFSWPQLVSDWIRCSQGLDWIPNSRGVWNRNVEMFFLFIVFLVPPWLVLNGILRKIYVWHVHALYCIIMYMLWIQHYHRCVLLRILTRRPFFLQCSLCSFFRTNSVNLISVNILLFLAWQISILVLFLRLVSV